MRGEDRNWKELTAKRCPLPRFPSPPPPTPRGTKVQTVRTRSPPTYLPFFLPSFLLSPSPHSATFVPKREEIQSRARGSRTFPRSLFHRWNRFPGMQIGPRNALLSRFSFTESHPSCLFPYHFRKRTTSIHPFHSRPKEYLPPPRRIEDLSFSYFFARGTINTFDDDLNSNEINPSVGKVGLSRGE